MNSLRTENYLKSRVQSPTSNQMVTKKLLYYTFFTVVRCSLPHNTTQCFNNCQVAVTSRSEVIVTKGMSANQYCNYCSTATSLPSATPGCKATLLLALCGHTLFRKRSGNFHCSCSRLLHRNLFTRIAQALRLHYTCTSTYKYRTTLSTQEPWSHTLPPGGTMHAAVHVIWVWL